jgi:hypothetical protein
MADDTGPQGPAVTDEPDWWLPPQSEGMVWIIGHLEERLWEALARIGLLEDRVSYLRGRVDQHEREMAADGD